MTKAKQPEQLQLFPDFKQQVKELLDSAPNDTINSFFGSDFDVEIDNYDNEDEITFKTALKEAGITVEYVDNYGGEDCGSEYWSVYTFTNGKDMQYVKFNGSYYSYDGSTFDEWFFAKAVPKSGFDYIQETE